MLDARTRNTGGKMGKTVENGGLLIWRTVILMFLTMNVWGLIVLEGALHDHDRVAADLFMETLNGQNDLFERQGYIIEKQEEHQESLADLWNANLLTQDKASYAANTASQAYHHMLEYRSSLHAHRGMPGFPGEKTVEPPR
jgi:hypothetical protein